SSAPLTKDDKKRTGSWWFCILAVDIHAVDLPALPPNDTFRLCIDDLGRLMPLSMPPRKNLLPAAHYMRTDHAKEDNADLPPPPLMFCSAEFEEFLLFYSTALIRSNKGGGGGKGDGGGDHET